MRSTATVEAPGFNPANRRPQQCGLQARPIHPPANRPAEQRSGEGCSCFLLRARAKLRNAGFTATCREPDRIKWFDECVGLKSIVVASNPLQAAEQWPE